MAVFRGNPLLTPDITSIKYLINLFYGFGVWVRNRGNGSPLGMIHNVIKSEFPVAQQDDEAGIINAVRSEARPRGL